jgi:dUTP pyrophosphatase
MTFKDQMKLIVEQLYQIKVEVLPGGTVPTKAHASDAGFDLYCSDDVEILPGQIIKHPLNIRLELPVNTYAQIESRSGLGLKGFLPLSKIIDRAYRGVPHIVATNVGPNPLVFKKGDRIAQMIIHSHSEHYYMQQVDKVDTETDRGDGGFGNSGQ